MQADHHTLINTPSSIIANFQNSAPSAELQGRCPTPYKGYEKINFQALIDYQVWAKELRASDPLYENPELFSHCPPLSPFIVELRSHIESLLTVKPELKLLIAEIDFHTKSDSLSPSWYFGLCLRLQSALTDLDQISLVEKDFITSSSAKIAAFFRTLTQANAWKNQNLLHKICAYKEDDIETSLHSPELSYTLVEKIENTVKQKLSVPMHVPILGDGEVGLDFLLSAFLASIYPMGMPVNNGNHAHGIPMSQVAFSIHDYFHGEGDNKTEMAQKFAIKTAEKLFRTRKIPTSKIIEIASEYAVKRYMHMIQTIQQFIPILRSELETDKASFMKTIVALFNLTHEEYFCRTGLLKQTSFKRFIYKFESDESDLPFINLLKTSPINGITSLSDEEIKDTVLSSKNGGDEYSKDIYYSKPDLTQPYEYKVQRTMNQIKLSITDEKGREYIYEIPTLYSELANVDDNPKLLALAGFDISKPEFTEDMSQKKIDKLANIYFTVIAKRFSACEVHLQDTLLKLVPEEIQQTFEKTIAKMRAELKETISIFPVKEEKILIDESITSESGEGYTAF